MLESDPPWEFGRGHARRLMCLIYWTSALKERCSTLGTEIYRSLYVTLYYNLYRLCGLVVRVSGYRYRGPGFDPRRYQIFWVAVGVWNGVHSASWGQLRSYLNEKSSGSRSRKQRLTAVGTRCAYHVTPLCPLKLALTSPTGGGRSVRIVRVRTKATEFSLV